MKRQDPKSFGEIFDEYVAREGLTDTMSSQRACYLWPDIVGQGINRYTSKRYVEGTVLHVYITSASLREELNMLRGKLLEEINRRAGAALTDIRIH